MKPRIVIISKQTSYSKIVDEQTEFNDDDIIYRWKSSHDRHHESLNIVNSIVNKYGTVFNISVANVGVLSELPKVTMIITVGGDGTMLGASHNINSDTPVLGVNSDPQTSVGFFCTSTAQDIESYIQSVIEGKFEKTVLTRMMVKKNNRIITQRVLNDVLYCHTNPATTSSYIIEKRVADAVVFNESQKSSGFWIGPAAGSTGARRSAGFNPMDLSSSEIQLCVRELYHRPDQDPGMKFIAFGGEYSVHVRSKMSSAAMYIDGDHKVVPVELGDYVSFGVSNEPLIIVGKPQCIR